MYATHDKTLSDGAQHIFMVVYTTHAKAVSAPLAPTSPFHLPDAALHPMGSTMAWKNQPLEVTS